MKYAKGDTVNVRRSSNDARRRAPDDLWFTAPVVGRGPKYATVEINGRRVRFDGETGAEVTEYGGSARRICTDEEKAAAERDDAVREGLRKHKVFDLVHGRRWTLETLEAVLALLDAEKPRG